MDQLQRISGSEGFSTCLAAASVNAEGAGLIGTFGLNGNENRVHGHAWRSGVQFPPMASTGNRLHAGSA